MEPSIFVGPKVEDAIDRLAALDNIAGDPTAPLKLVVKGRAEVGLQLPRGWVFEQGYKVELELTFSPAVQREILMK